MGEKMDRQMYKVTDRQSDWWIDIHIKTERGTEGGGEGMGRWVWGWVLGQTLNDGQMVQRSR